MAQPLFIEVTVAGERRTKIIGLAHIATIDPHSGGGALIRLTGINDALDVVTVESYEQVKAALGTIWQAAP